MGLKQNPRHIWGSAMAGAMEFTTPAQDAKMFTYFKKHENAIFCSLVQKFVLFPDN